MINNDEEIATDAQQPDDRIVTGPFVSLLVSNGVLRICTFMLTTIVPLYALHLGLSPAGAGLTTTIYMSAAVLVRPLAGRLVDVRGRWLVILLGSSIFCAAAGLTVIALPIWAFLVDRALQGIGFSFNGTAVMTLATDIIPERRLAQGISYLGIEQTVAQIAGPWLALELVTSAGYTTTFAVVFALTIVNLLVRMPIAQIARRLELERATAVAAAAETDAHAVDRPAASAPWASVWHRIVEKDAWRPSAVMGIVMRGSTTVGTFLAAFAFQRGIEHASLFFVCSGVALALSRFAVPTIGARVGQRSVIGVAILVVAAGLALVAWMPSAPVLMVAGVCYGLGSGAVSPGLNALAVVAADPRSRGLANSTFFMAMDLANAVGAAALGLVADAAGYAVMFAAAATLVACAFVAFRRLAVTGGAAAPAH